ncbi:MAG: hypothetical protein GY816_18320 [Cytophagales bacterium]|nr:hypothetical protein [Cytophagales bacterium]
MKATNQLFVFLILLTGIILISCGKDDDPDPKIEFIDQALQGKIDGLDFVYGDALVKESFFNAGDLSFEIFDEAETDAACDIITSDLPRVIFTIPNEIGLIELSLDMGSGDGQTITLYNPDGSMNVIMTEGALEILTITSTEITGRIDAQMDSDNFVNGNFTAGFCPV